MKTLFLIIVLFLAIDSHAQTAENTQAFSAGVEINAPSSNTYVIGAGVSLKFEIPIASPVNLTVTSGYNALFRENQFFDYGGGEARVLSFIPLKAGGRYYFKPKIYGEAEAGAAFRLNADSRALFAVSAGGGYILDLRGNGALDFGVRVEHWQSQLNMVALKIAYRFL